MKSLRVIILAAVLAGSLLMAGPLWGAQDVLWSQSFNFPGYNTIVIGAVTAAGNSLIVCGTAYNYPGDTGDIGFIKAFDQTTGNPIPGWNKTLSTGSNRNSFYSLAVVGNTVVVEGYSSTYTLNSSNLAHYTLNESFLQAFNADTGTSVWGPIIKNEAPTNLGPFNMVAANSKVFVVRNQNGPSDESGSTGKCIVEAYQAGVTTAPVTSLLLQQ